MAKIYNCNQCKKDFVTSQRSKLRIIKYCSKICCSNSRKGKKMPWLYTKEVLLKNNSNRRRGEMHSYWKGDKATHA